MPGCDVVQQPPVNAARRCHRLHDRFVLSAEHRLERFAHFPDFKLATDVDLHGLEFIESREHPRDDIRDFFIIAKPALVRDDEYRCAMRKRLRPAISAHGQPDTAVGSQRVPYE